MRRPNPRSGTRIRPPEVPFQDDDSTPLAFSLRHTTDEYGLDACTNVALQHFAHSLWRRRQMTWRELLQAPRQGLGYERIPRDAILRPVPPSITGDIERFIVFRAANGAGRIVGFRAGAVFHIVWYDTAFDLYNHG